MSFAGLNTHNYSLYAVPAAWVVAIGTHFYAIALYNKEKAPGSKAWDNNNPMANRRDFLSQAKLSPYMSERFLKAEAANDNSMINLPLFAAAIAMGNYARLSPSFLNTVAGLYLGSRLAYSWLYINGNTDLLGNMRSAAYLTGVWSCFAVFIQAGRKLF